MTRIVIASLVCAAVAVVVPFELVRAVFAIPLVIFLPGYAITAAAFARRPLAGPTFLLLSVALSLATLALGSLLLNYLPGGITALSWALLLLLVIVNGCRTAALRRAPAPEGSLRWPSLRPSPVEGLLLGAGLAVAAAAVVLALTPLPAKNALGYTELWIMTARPDPGVAVVRIGVRSEEKREISYFVRVRFGAEKPVVRLLGMEPGESRTIRLETPAPPSRPVKVTAALFRQAQPSNVYRRVVAEVPAAEAPR